jgi:hypothetical protein
VHISLPATHPTPTHPPLPRSPEDNQYAHPLDLVPLVDLNLKKVVRIDMQRAPPKVRHLGSRKSMD